MELNKERKVRMGQQDLYQSDFYEDKERFADVFNGVLFEGREVMKPEELETEDSVMVSAGDSRSEKKVICDKIRKWKGRFVSVMVLENQSYVDYRMVLRVMESLSCGKDLKKMRQVLKENIVYKELDELTVKAIAGILKLKINLEKIAKVNEEGKVVYDMCQAFEDYKEEGKREGEVLALKTAVNNLMKNQKVTFETAAEMLGISKSTQKQLLL